MFHHQYHKKESINVLGLLQRLTNQVEETKTGTFNWACSHIKMFIRFFNGCSDIKNYTTDSKINYKQHSIKNQPIAKVIYTKTRSTQDH